METIKRKFILPHFTCYVPHVYYKTVYYIIMLLYKMYCYIIDYVTAFFG